MPGDGGGIQIQALRRSGRSARSSEPACGTESRCFAWITGTSASADFDAIASVGAMEHFGAAELAPHFRAMVACLRPEGQMLNHCITRACGHERHRAGAFIDRYVFPDGELESLTTVIAAMNEQGFEIRHEENLREHYAMTLGEWGRNLERNWARAVAEVGERRARVWRLYMAFSRIGFTLNHIQIHQVLGVRVGRDGSSGSPPRPSWGREEPGLPSSAAESAVIPA